jgi:HSP20 family molecular chaperone IbpA
MSNETKLRKHDGDAPEKMAQRATVIPAVDIFENKDELLIFADLPGVSKDSLAISFDKRQLTLEGRLREFGPDEEPFDYRRTFVVPQGIDAEKISASLQNGVLRLSLPKPAALKPRQIAVSAG